MEYKRISITIPKELFIKYKEFIDSNGVTLSGRLAVLITKDLKNKSLN